MTQKLPQIFTVILRIFIGKVEWFAVYICDSSWVTQYAEIRMVDPISGLPCFSLTLVRKGEILYDFYIQDNLFRVFFSV